MGHEHAHDRRNRQNPQSPQSPHFARFVPNLQIPYSGIWSRPDRTKLTYQSGPRQETFRCGPSHPQFARRGCTSNHGGDSDRRRHGRWSSSWVRPPWWRRSRADSSPTRPSVGSGFPARTRTRSTDSIDTSISGITRPAGGDSQRAGDARARRLPMLPRRSATSLGMLRRPTRRPMKVANSRAPLRAMEPPARARIRCRACSPRLRMTPAVPSISTRRAPRGRRARPRYFPSPRPLEFPILRRRDRERPPRRELRSPPPPSQQ